MSYVIGVDLGTSAVKILLVDRNGDVVQEETGGYPSIQEKTGCVEQNPEDWVSSTILALSRLMKKFDGDPREIEGMCFSGQMHGLVLLDKDHNVLRNAILWNDTRTTEECQEIYKTVGKKRLYEITKNPALEGFTLPKILWVQKYEPEIFHKVDIFLLPKDYVRYRLTGELCTDYSDAAGTLLLDIAEKDWSDEICHKLNIRRDICPPLVASHDQTGTIISKIAFETGLKKSTKVFAGGADNACSAIGSGILEEGKTLCSIGTSGVILSYETNCDKELEAEGIHCFVHSEHNAYYTMGVTLAAGDSLSWFKDIFAAGESVESLAAEVNFVTPGAQGLLFTPYISGERTPYNNAVIRGSFIGMDRSHEKKHFVQAVMEGVTFSLNQIIDVFRQNGKDITTIVSTGGGSKSSVWLHMQANIFDAEIVKLSSEQGPGLGAAMLAAYGCDWFNSLQECGNTFLNVEATFLPNQANTEEYKELFKIYQSVYSETINLNQKLVPYRK